LVQLNAEPLGGSGASMKLSEWANVAEIASALAVVVSLVYVGVEVGQNTAAVKASTHQAMIDYGREQSEILVTNASLADFVEQGERDPGSLTPHERRQFYEFTTWRMAMWELSFLNHEAGLVDGEMWRAWDAYYRFLVSGKPGYREFWRDNGPAYDSRFIDHVHSVTMD
jgi:hypothetical protein